MISADLVRILLGGTLVIWHDSVPLAGPVKSEEA